ncbi:MAG: GIY-YIG nuclease family protein [bacterium]|nr:GIY-YIG nuclease family protein [bacterium]
MVNPIQDLIAMGAVGCGRGAYILGLCLATRRRVRLGGLGWHVLDPGWYFYVGSARGPGGLTARLGHHLRPAVNPHWHIDHLRRHARLESIWYGVHDDRRECVWAARLAGAAGLVVPVARFGASDCRCPAHLFFAPKGTSAPITASAAGAAADADSSLNRLIREAIGDELTGLAVNRAAAVDLDPIAGRLITSA